MVTLCRGEASLCLLAGLAALRRQHKPCRAAVLLFLCLSSFSQGFEAVGSVTGLLDTDVIQVDGFAGGWFQAAVSHEMVL